MKPLREAIAAAWLADLRPSNRDWEVSLTPQREEFPDFRLRSEGDVWWFEEVEARYPSLALGGDQIQGWRHDDPEHHFRAGMAVVAQQIARKAAKGYGPKPLHLLVYGNFWSGEVLEHEADRIVAPFLDSFASVSLVWSCEVAVRLGPNPCKLRARHR